VLILYDNDNNNNDDDVYYTEFVYVVHLMITDWVPGGCQLTDHFNQLAL